MRLDPRCLLSADGSAERVVNSSVTLPRGLTGLRRFHTLLIRQIQLLLGLDGVLMAVIPLKIIFQTPNLHY